MALDDDLQESAQMLDVWGNHVATAAAQATSLINYLLMDSRDSVVGGLPGSGKHGTFAYDTKTLAGLGGQLFPATGGEFTHPLSALGQILSILRATGMLDNPEMLARLSDAFNAQLGIGEAAAGTNAVRIRRNKVGVALENEADLIDFLTEMVRRNQATPLIEALGVALGARESR